MAVPYFNSHSLNPVAQKSYESAVSSSGSVLNGCPQCNGVAFGLEVQQTEPNNYLNTSNPYGERFHNPFNDYRFPKVLVRVLYHQDPTQSKPLGLSDKSRAQQQSDENILYTDQSEIRIGRVWSMAVIANSQPHSINASPAPLDSILKDTAGNGSSGMGRSTLQIPSVVDNNLHQPVHIPDQDRIDTFFKPEAPTAIITPQLNCEQLQQKTSSKNRFDFNASASVSGESLTSSPDKASQKAYLEAQKASRKACEQSEKRKASRKAYNESDKGKAYQKAYRQSEKWKAYQKAYRQSEKGKACQKAYRQSDKGKAALKAALKAYRTSDKGKAALKAYQKAYHQSDGRKAYHKAYHEVFKKTGDREQAKIAGQQARDLIKKSNKTKKSELESISISPLRLAGKSIIEG